MYGIAWVAWAFAVGPFLCIPALVLSFAIYAIGVTVAVFTRQRFIVIWAERAWRSATALYFDMFRNIHDAIYSKDAFGDGEFDAKAILLSILVFLAWGSLVLFLAATFWLGIWNYVGKPFFETSHSAYEQEQGSELAPRLNQEGGNGLAPVGMLNQGMGIDFDSAPAKNPEELIFEGMLESLATVNRNIIFDRTIRDKLTVSDCRLVNGFYVASWRLKSWFEAQILVIISSRDFDPIVFLTGPRLSRVIGNTVFARDGSGKSVTKIIFYAVEEGEYNVFLTSRRPGGLGHYELLFDALHE